MAMDESRQIIRLNANGSWAQGLEVRVFSATKSDGDEHLTMEVRSGFLLEGEPSMRKLGPEEAKALWDVLNEFEFRSAESSAIGLDGTTYALRILTEQIDAGFDWWEAMPSEWAGPRRLVSQLLRLAGSEAAEFRR
jgi:hypothetical protein